MPRSRYRIFEDQYPHFLTCTVVNWLPIFGDQVAAQSILDSLRFLQDQDRLTVYAYVIMENHLHLIAASDELSSEMGKFKSYTARKIIDHFKTSNAKHILRQLEYYKLRHKKDGGLPQPC